MSDRVSIFKDGVDRKVEVPKETWMRGRGALNRQKKKNNAVSPMHLAQLVSS